MAEGKYNRSRERGLNDEWGNRSMNVRGSSASGLANLIKLIISFARLRMISNNQNYKIFKRCMLI
jgi:hypothetical protein